MPLPKISTPTYELELPSTGKKIRYRPFLVREEKILIMALESEDMKQISSAVVQILSDCIATKTVKVSELSTFDIESVKIRSMCGANIDCDAANAVAVQADLSSAGYTAYGTRSPAHLERTTNVSGSLMVGIKLDF